ncbi:MAG: histidine kinase [Agriterribacter sp.]
MKIELPQYTSRDNQIMLLVIIPFSIGLNSAIFGKMYFTNWKVFVSATLISGVAFCLDFILCGVVAMLLKQRFPSEKDTRTKLIIMILTFWMITGLFLYSLFRGYELIHFFGYTFQETPFVWSCVALGIVNVFLTFLMEGVSGYERWLGSIKETEQLSKAYNQSRMLGLKSQVNPHFLFNSLNSLSSLIHEDETKAEKFLNEMSKVYRYLLRNDEDQLVTLQTELKFIESYIFLLKTRYGEGFQLTITVDESDLEKWIPTLTLQVIIENAFSQNTISKTDPLIIAIDTKEDDILRVANSVRPKIIEGELNHEAGLDNLLQRYKLLNQPLITIEDSAAQRVIRIPLITKKEEVPA